MRQSKQHSDGSNVSSHLAKNGASHIMGQKRSFYINRSAKCNNAQFKLGFGGTTAEDSSATQINQDVSIEIDEGGFAPKSQMHGRSKGKEEAQNQHARMSTKQNGLSVGKDLRSNCNLASFEQKINRQDHESQSQTVEGVVQTTPRRTNQRYSVLRDQCKDPSQEEATTATTKNQRLDKFFKYSLLKRKKDAIQGGGDDSADANFSANQDGSCYADDESDDYDSSSYNGEGALVDRRKRKSKRKLGGARGAAGPTKKISKRNIAQSRKQQVFGYCGKGTGKRTLKLAKKQPNEIVNLEQQRMLQQQMLIKKQERLIADGVSVFDLIMIWKTEIKKSPLADDQLKKRALSRVVKCSRKKEQYVQCENYSKHIKNAQAILINPPWDSIVGTRTGTPSENTGKITFDEFCSKLTIPMDVMKDGLLFIWVEKEYISKVIKFFEDLQFYYVENMCYIMLDQNKKEEIDLTRQTNINESFVKQKYSFLQKSKKTLLILRRTSNKKACCTLELRHQRTCDVCFDWAVVKDKPKDDPDLVKQLQRSLNFGQKLTKEMQNTLNQSGIINNDGIPRNEMFKPNNYVYKLIETLLPKAMVDESEPKDGEHKELKLLELWGLDDSHRKGWVKIIQN